MGEIIPENYAIMFSLEETKKIIENNTIKNMYSHNLDIKKHAYDDSDNTFNLEIGGLFSSKKCNILLTPTKNGTNIFVDCDDERIVRRIITSISNSLI
ncbi:MAG: hypothetical protein LBM96_01170 [Methanobrevibacter sp.]|jgi:hypothetical protein|nr:hypothetical protein [Candidatus Methanoflexus mossambicus]